MDREGLIHLIELLDTKTHLDEQFLCLLKDQRYPDISILRWLDIKYDYKISLVDRGLNIIDLTR